MDSSSQSMFDGLQQDMWAMAFRIFWVVGIYAALPFIAIMLISMFLFRLKRTALQLVSMIAGFACMIFFVYHGLPQLTK